MNIETAACDLVKAIENKHDVDFTGTNILELLKNATGWVEDCSPTRTETPVPATPPADAALSDVLKVVECQLGHAADVSATYVAFTRDETMQIRAALRARAVPEGFVMVPVEPTIDMIAALGFCGDVDIAIGHANACVDVVRDYKAMLAASKAAEWKV